MADAIYFKVTSFEAGIGNTGKRTSNYHCDCIIFDADKNPIKHPLSDTFFGKWSKCQTVINRWYKKCERAKLVDFFASKAAVGDADIR